MAKKIEVPFFRTGYNYDMNAASEETALKTSGQSLTRQEFKDECDINTLLKRFHLTGELPQGVRVPTYGDFEGTSNYQDALNMLMEADEAFMQMPADIRYRFANDPGKFLEFVHDEKNRDEAIRLGLVLPPAPSAPLQAGSPASSGVGAAASSASSSGAAPAVPAASAASDTRST